MGWGEAVRSSDQIVWPGESGLKSANPRLGGRQPGPDDPSEAKTPGEALAYIELLYKSGRTEDLATLLRRSQVFRTAWLILQQSSPDVSEATGEGKGSSYRGETRTAAGLPVPVGRPPSPTLSSASGSPGPEVGKAESFPQIPAVVMAARGGNDSFAPGYQAAQIPTSLLQAYLHQDGYLARENQRGQVLSIRA